MSWSKTVVTDVGTDLLNESIIGSTLTITHATGGSGKHSEEALKTATEVFDYKQTLQVLNIEQVENGKIVWVRITNEGVTESYDLNEVAIYGRVGDSGESSLLVITQSDNKGIEVPVEGNTNFNFELGILLTIASTAQVQVVVDDKNAVSAEFVERRIAEATAAIAEENLSCSAAEQSGSIVLAGFAEDYLRTGSLVKFPAPITSQALVDGLYIGEDLYSIVNSAGENLAGVEGAWEEGAMLSVVLDQEKKVGYLQNATMPASLTPISVECAENIGLTEEKRYVEAALIAMHANMSNYMPLSGGTFSGEVKAGEGMQTASAYLFRNSKISATEEEPEEGAICWVLK